MNLLEIDFGDLDRVLLPADAAADEVDVDLVTAYTLVFRWAVLWDNEPKIYAQSPDAVRLRDCVAQVIERDREIREACMSCESLLDLCRVTMTLLRDERLRQDLETASVLLARSLKLLNPERLEVTTYLFRVAAWDHWSLPSGWAAQLSAVPRLDSRLQQSFVFGNLLSALTYSGAPRDEIFALCLDSPEPCGTLLKRLAEPLDSYLDATMMQGLWPRRTRLMGQLLLSPQSSVVTAIRAGTVARNLGLPWNSQGQNDQDPDPDDADYWNLLQALLSRKQIPTDQEARAMLTRMREPTHHDRKHLRLLARYFRSRQLSYFDACVIANSGWRLTSEDFSLLAAVPLPPVLSVLVLRYVSEGGDTSDEVKKLRQLARTAWPDARAVLHRAIESCGLAVTEDPSPNLEHEDVNFQAVRGRLSDTDVELAAHKAESLLRQPDAHNLAGVVLNSVPYFDAGVARAYETATGERIDVSGWQQLQVLTITDPQTALRDLESVRQPPTPWVRNYRLRCLGFLGCAGIQDVPEDASATVLREAACVLSRQGMHQESLACLRRALRQARSRDLILEYAEQHMHLGDPQHAALGLVWAKRSPYVSQDSLPDWACQLSHSADPDVILLYETSRLLPVRTKDELYAALSHLLGLRRPTFPTVGELKGESRFVLVATALVLLSNVTVEAAEQDLRDDFSKLTRLLVHLTGNWQSGFPCVRACFTFMLDLLGFGNWSDAVRTQKRITEILWREWQDWRGCRGSCRGSWHEVQITDVRADAMRGLLTCALRCLPCTFSGGFRRPDDLRADLMSSWTRIAEILGVEAHFQWAQPEPGHRPEPEQEHSILKFPDLHPAAMQTLRANLAQVAVRVVTGGAPDFQADDDLGRVFSLYCGVSGMPPNSLGWEARFCLLMTAGLSLLAKRPESMSGWILDLGQTTWARSLAGPTVVDSW